MQQQQDIQIVEQLKNGDLSAFDSLFVKYYKLLCVSAYFRLGWCSPKAARRGRCSELVEVSPPATRTKDYLTKLADAGLRY
jgi:hypothetical protein